MTPPAPAIEIVVRGVCLSNDHLLVCRNIARGNIYLPGGHVEWGETSPQALAREWLEELACPCTPTRFLGILEQRYGDTCELGLYFHCTSPSLTSSTPPPSPEPHIAFDWLPLASLPHSPLLPADLRPLLPLWLSNPPPPAPLWYTPNLALSAPR